MELKPGYKLTELGVIPNDWNVKALGEFATVKDGTHQTPKYVMSGVPFYSVENVTSGDFVNTKFISLSEHRFLTKSFRMEKGDILMTRIGSIGDCKLIDWDVDASFYVSLALLKIDSGYSASYITQYSKSASFQKEVALNSLQSAIPRKINLGPISNIRLALPPINEQFALATALSDTDALINSLDKLIAKKRDIKQATMQQLLTGKTRLTGFSGEWEMKRLGEVVLITKGQLITEQTAISGVIPVIAGGKKPSYFHNSANRFGKTITISASGASAGYVAFYDFPIFASDCSTIGEGSGYSVEFIYYALVLIQNEIYKAQTGGAQPHIHPSDLKPMLISAPNTKAEQKAIANVLLDMDAELTGLEKQRDKTIAIKQGMMQELLTGRIRLV